MWPDAGYTPAPQPGPSRHEGDRQPELDPVRLRMLTDACVNLASDRGHVVRRRDVRERVRLLMTAGHINVARKIPEHMMMRLIDGIPDPTGEAAVRNVTRGQS